MGQGAVDRGEQRALAGARKAGRQLQVAARGGVDLHQALRLDPARPVEPRQEPLLRQLKIVEHRPGGREFRPAEAAEPFERGELEGPAQMPLGGDAVEALVRERGQRPARFLPHRSQRRVGEQAFGQQDLAGGEAGQRCRQHRWQGRLGKEGAGGDVHPGQAPAVAAGGNRKEEVAAPRVEQAVFGQRARGDDPHHVAPHQALAAAPPGLGRIFELLADRDLEALADQPVQVKLGIVDRHPAHRDVLARMPAALGERDVQGRGRRNRIFEEQLVEVAHAEEQECVGMGALEYLILRDHRARARRLGGVVARRASG
jgi:hypothetical protein